MKYKFSKNDVVKFEKNEKIYLYFLSREQLAWKAYTLDLNDVQFDLQSSQFFSKSFPFDVKKLL